MTGRYMVIKNGREVSDHNTWKAANVSQAKNGGYIQYHVGKTEAAAAGRPRRKTLSKHQGHSPKQR